MSGTKEWVVRVVMHKEAEFIGSLNATREVTMLLEQLRYSGAVQIHRDDDAVVFDILRPGSVSKNGSKKWADLNAQRMSTFGFNAVAAPRWEEVV
jgi:hypothetical protein